MTEFEIILTREESNGICTIGNIKAGSISILSMEDPPHDIKIWGNTRIPEGRYEILLRKEGRFHEVYKDRYVFHKGMLHLQDVPGYEYILIHTGNGPKDTAGCILPGSHKVGNNWVDDSEKAYIALYGYCIAILDLGYKLFIKIQ